MTHIRTIAGSLLLGLLLLAPGIAWAHGGPEVTVKPLTAKPGDTITVAGEDLGTTSPVMLSLKGLSGTIDLGQVQTDEDGGFTKQLVLPAELKAGSYQLQAVGGETAATQFTVSAAPVVSAPAASVPGAVTASQSQAAPASPEAVPAIRERSLIETAGLVALFGVIAALGLIFARTAHRVPQP